LREFLSRKPDPAPCAIGEIGLDFTRLPKDDREERIGWQRDAFARQLRLARSVGLPAVVHSRGTVSECLEGLAAEEFPGEKVVFHCFAEGPESLAAVREYGCRCSFTGLVTFKNAANVREALRLHGLGELMLETDSPYLSPEPFRGKPNHPARTAVVAEFCADLFGTDPDRIAKVTTRNTRRFFGLRPGTD
jgi:TatD DNase family protein